MDILFEAQAELGNKWAEIAQRLPGRPEAAVKNKFYAHVRQQEREAGILPGKKGSSKKSKLLADPSGRVRSHSYPEERLSALFSDEEEDDEGDLDFDGVTHGPNDEEVDVLPHPRPAHRKCRSLEDVPDVLLSLPPPPNPDRSRVMGMEGVTVHHRSRSRSLKRSLDTEQQQVAPLSDSSVYGRAAPPALLSSLPGFALPPSAHSFDAQRWAAVHAPGRVCVVREHLPGSPEGVSISPDGFHLSPPSPYDEPELAVELDLMADMSINDLAALLSPYPVDDV